MRIAASLVAAAVATTLAGCGTPEAKCREGVDTLKAALVGKVGSGKHKELNDPVNQAHTLADMAQTQLATGNYDGCLENLEKARDVLATVAP